jgi:hypothetical protein
MAGQLQEIVRFIDDRFSDVLFFAVGFCLLALMEWVGYLARIPREPIGFTCATIVAVTVAAWRFVEIRKQVSGARLISSVAICKERGRKGVVNLERLTCLLDWA